MPQPRRTGVPVAATVPHWATHPAEVCALQSLPAREIAPQLRFNLNVDAAGPQGRYAVADGVANRNVWLDGIATFGIFGHELEKTTPVFWFMMQIAMLAGFATSYPVNRRLLNSGIKEPM